MKSILLSVTIIAAAIVPYANALEVLVGTDAEFPPFQFINSNREITGFDIELIKSIGEEVGFTVKIVNQPFNTLIPAIEDGRLDIAVAGMTITPERAEKVAFSEPYYDAGQVIVVQERIKNVAIMNDLKEKRIGVQLETTGEELITETFGKNNSNMILFKKYNEAFYELQLGRIDAVVIDAPVARNYVKRMKGLKIASELIGEEQYGIAVNLKNKELLDKINAGLKAITESGKMDELLEKWFSDDAEVKKSE